MTCPVPLPQTLRNWSLRRAIIADAGHLPAIELSASELFKTAPELEGTFAQTSITPALHRQLIAQGHCLVAQYEGRPVGFLAADPSHGELHIEEISVHADFQRNGIGTALVRACINAANTARLSAVTLTCFRDVAWNGPFYTRLGFVEIDDSTTHPRLTHILEWEAAHGFPRERRCAMIYSLDSQSHCDT